MKNSNIELGGQLNKCNQNQKDPKYYSFKVVKTVISFENLFL